MNSQVFPIVEAEKTPRAECSNRIWNSRGHRMERSSATGISLRTIALVQMCRSSIAATTSFSTRLWVLVLFAVVVLCIPSFAQDQSPPPILQWFESSYRTVEERTPDVFMAGYGFVWLPPPFRADTGDQSVGYDVYDRFDLGRPGRPTLYGTETGLRNLASMLHRAAIDLHIDFVMNHNGYSNLATPGFVAAGGYPGLAITLPDDVDGDFHSAYAMGVQY